MGHSIVDIQHMGDAFRNTGYKNIESAVSEIIDNSVEAHSSNIFIILSESINIKTGRKIVSEIAFLDDGDGMEEKVLAKCLGIGAGTRRERKGMGRFGVGLPQSSLYACPCVSVYSWQNGIDNCKKVNLDIDKVKKGIQTEIEDPQAVSLPKKYRDYIKYKTLTENYDFTEHGTLVIWEKCDRISPKTRGPLSERLEFSLGQKFRYFIHENKLEIKIICHENPDAAIGIYPNDPLFLMDNNYVLGNPKEPGTPYIKQNGAELEPFFELYKVDGVGDGEVNIPVKYYDKNGDVAESSVLARFSIVKPKFYDETAFPKGTNPGSYRFGKKIAAKMEGISIIRANREIDFRKFDFYDNINEPQHRWWGCEIIFDPELDEAFGVANNKQYVELKEIESEDIDYDEEVQPIWTQLYPVIHNTIKSMYNKNESTRSSTRTFEDNQTPSTNIINEVENEENEFDEFDGEKENEVVPTDEAIKEGKEELQEQGFDDVTEEQVLAFLRNKVNFRYENKGERAPAFDYKIVFSTTVITINTSHKFYTSFLSKIYGSSDAQVTFELLLASLIQSIKQTNTYQQNQNDKLVSLWYNKLNRYIEKQLDPDNL